MARRRIAVIDTLEEHPNLSEILGILAQLPHIADSDLERLAAAWQNTVSLAEARARALDADSPLVLEVLAAFEAVQSLFAEDLDGDEDYVQVDPEVATVALKAVRDAIAAAYARPILTRTEHAGLMTAWRAVYPTDAVDEPDLGLRAAEVKALLSAMPVLATRCHDESAAALYDAILDASWVLDEDVRTVARDEAWQAAILTSRRRVWGLVRRSAAEGIGRFCPSCRIRSEDHDTVRVLGLCLDAACALLVADAIDDNLVDVLTLPVQTLIPRQRAAD
ncbi:MAG: hypothetical protein QOJ03_990 [Frankiaceae bacterium]|jgi:hypothetical protein|nr:hypothetical protein [Frankiaceae bacterium]